MRSSSISINLEFFSSPALFFDYESRGRFKTELKVIFKISSDYEYGLYLAFSILLFSSCLCTVNSLFLNSSFKSFLRHSVNYYIPTISIIVFLPFLSIHIILFLPLFFQPAHFHLSRVLHFLNVFFVFPSCYTPSYFQFFHSQFSPYYIPRRIEINL